MLHRWRTSCGAPDSAQREPNLRLTSKKAMKTLSMNSSIPNAGHRLKRTSCNVTSVGREHTSGFGYTACSTANVRCRRRWHFSGTMSSRQGSERTSISSHRQTRLIRFAVSAWGRCAISCSRYRKTRPCSSGLTITRTVKVNPMKTTAGNCWNSSHWG